MEKNKISGYRKLPFGEEVANSVTHGVMAALILILMPAISVYSYIIGGWSRAIGVGIFLCSLFLMFITSCLYHSSHYGTKHKTIMRVLDHCMIYVAIAGSYTPISITLIGGWLGIFVIVVQWLAVLIGILYKSISKKAKPVVSVGVYLIMGWSAIFVLPVLISNGQFMFLLLLFLGGILYTIGAGFYISKKNWSHAVWHFFINFAALSHMIAIIFFM